MIILQALVNGIVSGTLLAVPAIGFTAMFAVLRFPNFSVSGVATLGAFAGYLAYGAGLQMAGSLAIAFAVAGMAGLAFDKVAHLPLIKQGALAGGHRLDRHRADPGERRAAGLRQRAARLRPADRARCFHRRDPRQPAANRDHGPGAAPDAAGVRGARLHPHRQGHARLGRQSRAGGAEGHPARAHRHLGELRRHGPGRRRRHAAGARQLDRSADRHAHPAVARSPPPCWAGWAARPAPCWAPS